MMKKRLLALMVVMALSLSAAAKPADAETSEDVALELVQVIGVEQQFRTMIPALTRQIMASMRQRYSGIDQRTGEIITEEVIAEFRRRMPELLDEVASVFSRHFDYFELVEITDFLGSDLGRKAIRIRYELGPNPPPSAVRQRFTAKELSRLEEFRQSGVVAKFMQLRGRMMQEAVQAGHAWGRRSALEILPRVVERLREEGVAADAH